LWRRIRDHRRLPSFSKPHNVKDPPAKTGEPDAEVSSLNPRQSLFLTRRGRGTAKRWRGYDAARHPVQPPAEQAKLARMKHMRRLLILAATAALGATPALADPATNEASTPPPAPPTPRLAPHWVRRPSADDFARAYPPRALAQHLSGRATMKCKVTDQGAMADCQIIDETPPGAGFGAAELALAPEFKMTGMQPGGGATVVIPVHFLAP
jgi:TonB family protein